MDFDRPQLRKLNTRVDFLNPLQGLGVGVGHVLSVIATKLQVRECKPVSWIVAIVFSVSVDVDIHP